MPAKVAGDIRYRQVPVPPLPGGELGQGPRPEGLIDASEWIAERDQLLSRGLDGATVEGGPRHLREQLEARRQQQYEAMAARIPWRSRGRGAR